MRYLLIKQQMAPAYFDYMRSRQLIKSVSLIICVSNAKSTKQYPLDLSSLLDKEVMTRLQNCIIYGTILATRSKS